MEHEEPMQVEGEVVDMVTNDKALAAITRAEVDIQISTAHRFPRSIDKSRKRVTDLACATEDVAASCFYSIPREGKTITGPSIRFAEIVASSWGNLRVQARITEIGETQVVAQSACHDLEANVAMMGEARVRITKKNGQRYSDDMIGVACSAALSKATRNAIFKVVPMATFADISAKVKQVAGGDSKSLEQNRKAALDYIKSEYKVDAKRVCRVLGVAGIAEITTEHVAELRGMVTAIKEGDATVADCFPEPTLPDNPNGKTTKFFGDKKGDEPPAGEPAVPEAPPASDNTPSGDLFGEGGQYADLITAINDEVPGCTREKVRAAIDAMLEAGLEINQKSVTAQVRMKK